MANEFDSQFMKGPMDDLGMIRISGSIEHVIYANEENGYAICDLGTDTDELITITGMMPYIGDPPQSTKAYHWLQQCT